MIRIVQETTPDIAARETLLDAAFGKSRFSKTSERLREGRLPSLAFVMKDGFRLIGTLRLWPIAAGPGRPALLLGPLAVDAAFTGRGFGSRLMRHALGKARSAGHDAVLLVGDAPYYERFGFAAGSTGGLWLPGPVERDRFLGLELAKGALAGAAGMVSATGELRPKPDLADLLADIDAGRQVDPNLELAA
jgi:predicted N-acetyltransferase YhbS